MDVTHGAAAQTGIKTLYHYEPFNIDYLTTTLEQHKVHVSDPSALNDPWDCRPWFDESALEDVEVLEQFVTWCFSFTPTAPVSEAEVRATKHKIRTDPEYRRGILTLFSEHFLQMIPNRWKIYCLTPVPDSTLMWSHYADNHRGICLEFGTDTPLVGRAREVEYLRDYPKWSPNMLGDTGPHILLTKSDDWKYEREYRIIGLSDGIDRPFDARPLLVKDNFLKLPTGALKAVIVGCEANFANIERTVRSVAPEMPIKHAVRSPSKYRLQIVDSSIALHQNSA